MNRHHHMSWIMSAGKAYDFFTRELETGSIIEINAREHDSDTTNYEYDSTVFVRIKSIVPPKRSFWGKVDTTTLQVIVETLDGRTMELLEYGKWGGGARKAEYAFSLSEAICKELERKRYRYHVNSRLFLEVRFNEDPLALKRRMGYIFKLREERLLRDEESKKQASVEALERERIEREEQEERRKAALEIQDMFGKL